MVLSILKEQMSRSTITYDCNNDEPQLGRVVAKSADKLIAICNLRDMQLQPIRVFNL